MKSVTWQEWLQWWLWTHAVLRTKSKLHAADLQVLYLLFCKPTAITGMNKHNSSKFHFRPFAFWSSCMIFFREQVLTVSLHFWMLRASLPHHWYIWCLLRLGGRTNGRCLISFSILAVFQKGSTGRNVHTLMLMKAFVNWEAPHHFMFVRQAFSQCWPLSLPWMLVVRF